MEFLFVWVLLIVVAYKVGRWRGRNQAEAGRAKDDGLVVDTTEEDLREGRTGFSIIGGVRPPREKRDD